MNETTLTKKIRKALEAKGAWVLKVHQTAYGRKGVPDLLVCYQGRFIALEVKVPGREGTLTALQEREIRLIREAGGRAEMVTSVEDALDALRI